MHLAKLSQEYRHNHYPGDNRKLRGLKIDRPQMQPATCPIYLRADELRQDEKHDTRQVHRQRAPADPAVVNQTGRHERKDTDSHPIRLLSPEIRCVRISARGSRAVNCHNPKDGEREHRHQKQPVLTEQFSQKGRHAV